MFYLDLTEFSKGKIIETLQVIRPIYTCMQSRLWDSGHCSYGECFVSIRQNSKWKNWKRHCNSVGQSMHICDQEDFNRIWASVYCSYGEFFFSIWHNFQKGKNRDIINLYIPAIKMILTRYWPRVNNHMVIFLSRSNRGFKWKI